MYIRRRFPPLTLNFVIISFHSSSEVFILRVFCIQRIRSRRRLPFLPSVAGLDLLRLTVAGELVVGRSVGSRERHDDPSGRGPSAFTSGILKTVRFLTHETSIRLCATDTPRRLYEKEKLSAAASPVPVPFLPISRFPSSAYTLTGEWGAG